MPLLHVLTVRDMMEEAGPGSTAGVGEETVVPDTPIVALVPRLAAGFPGFAWLARTADA